MRLMIDKNDNLCIEAPWLKATESEIASAFRVRSCFGAVTEEEFFEVFPKFSRLLALLNPEDPKDAGWSRTFPTTDLKGCLDLWLSVDHPDPYRQFILTKPENGNDCVDMTGKSPESGFPSPVRSDQETLHFLADHPCCWDSLGKTPPERMYIRAILSRWIELGRPNLEDVRDEDFRNIGG